MDSKDFKCRIPRIAAALIVILVLTCVAVKTDKIPVFNKWDIASTDVFTDSGFKKNLIWIDAEYDYYAEVEFSRTVNDDPRAESLQILRDPSSVYPGNPQPRYIVTYWDGIDLFASDATPGVFRFSTSELESLYSDNVRNNKTRESHVVGPGESRFWNGKKEVTNDAEATGYYRERPVTNGLHIDPSNCSFGVWEQENYGTSTVFYEHYIEYYLYQ